MIGRRAEADARSPRGLSLCLLALCGLLSACAPAGADTAVPAPARAGVACQSVDDCWLDDNGRPIKRPARFRRRRLPRGDCGNNLVWLQNRLQCVENQCVAVFIGDRC